MSDAKTAIDLDRPAWLRAGMRSAERERRRLKVVAALAAGDVLVSACALALLAAGLRIVERQGAPFGAAAFLGSAGLIATLGLLFGLYDTLRLNPVELFRRRVQSAAVFCAFLIAMAEGELLAPVHALAWLALVCATVVLGTAVVGLVEAALKRLGLWQTRVVLVGEPAATLALCFALDAHPTLGLRVLARVPADDPRLADPRDLSRERADMAILLSSGDGRRDEAAAARLNFPSVVIAGSVGDVRGLWARTRMIGSAVGIEVRRSPLRRDRWMKRAIDLAVGGSLLVASLPVIAAVAAAIWCVDRRGPFYAQERPGLGGRMVRVWKVRSMFVDAAARLDAHLAADPEARAEWARAYKLRRDPRILPGIGHFIRRASIDELPQLWNVVRGDMSLVGPRPFPAYHLGGFDESFRALRASVMPGLTGFWQITARSDGDLVVQQSADEFYVRNWSLWLDLYILLHTPPAVLFGKGAR